MLQEKINYIRWLWYNINEMLEFIGKDLRLQANLIRKGDSENKPLHVVYLIIPTEKGDVKADLDDYIVKDDAGNLYVLNPRQFNSTYVLKK